MCGIFGILQPGTRLGKLTPLGQQANREQAHRGPDQEGIVENDGWLLAHRRLSIFDLSTQGKQPMTRGDHLTIVFNGAVYNFLELRDELTGLGHQFRTNTDTEVILAAYVAWGTACFARFNGMWAVAIIDEQRRELVLSRDRIGIKPLYLYTGGGQLSFASETRALRRTVGEGSTLNHEVARDFLLYGWQDHREGTIWAGINQYPPGYVSVYGLDDLRRKAHERYYDFPRQPLTLSSKALQKQFLTLFTDAVRLRKRSDVGCGLTLSGGIDSSAIAGLLGPEHMTYSVRFPSTVYDESAYIDAVLRHRRLKNRSIRPGWDDFLRDYQACLRGQDQPLASAAVVMHYTLMGLLREAGETVVLNGQGADELGGGYDKFYLPYLREQLQKGWLTALGSSLAVARKLQLGPDQLRNRLQRLTAPTAPSTFLAPAYRAQSSFVRTPDRDVRQTSLNLIGEVGLPNLLRHEDRSSMAHGIESRTPFLDYRLVDFLLAAPSEFKLHEGMRKWGIRESLRPVLAPEVYARKRKLGFATPQVIWMEEHPDFFVAAIRQYVAQPGALLTAGAGDFAQEVLRKRRRLYYPLVWRWWGWAVFVGQVR